MTCQKALLNPRSQRLIPMDHSLIFIDLYLTFKPLTYLELIFVFGLKGSSFIVPQVNIQLSQHHLLKTVLGRGGGGRETRVGGGQAPPRTSPGWGVGGQEG